MQTKRPEKLSASLEDYVEVIFNLCGKDGSARSKDIADALSVAKPSVTGALKALSNKGLINYRPYGCVSLTDDGIAEAGKIVKKHFVLETFFTDVLCLDKGLAKNAACRAEHALGSDVITRLLGFIEFVSCEGDNGRDIIGSFRKYYDRAESQRYLDA